jgi:hypothetical protein
MNYTRLTIEALKEAAASLAKTGKINDDAIGKAITKIKIGIDTATVNSHPTTELEQYAKDLEFIRYKLA